MGQVELIKGERAIELALLRSSVFGRLKYYKLLSYLNDNLYLNTYKIRINIITIIKSIFSQIYYIVTKI